MAQEETFVIEHKEVDGQLEVICSGEVEFGRINSFHRKLLQLTSGYRQVNILMKELTEVNPGIAQVLISAKKQKDMKLTVHLQTGREQLQVLENSGLNIFFDKITLYE